MKTKSIIVIVALCISFLGCNAQNEKEKADISELKGPYFGQDPPGKTPVLFAPELFNAEFGYHTTVIFSQDLAEAIWSPMTREGMLMYTKMTNGIWTPPQKAVFGPISNADGGMFSPKGNRLYFTSFYNPSSSELEAEHIWFVNRIRAGWSKPELIDEVIRAHPTHWTFSFAKNGNLYFTSEKKGVRGEQDIYISRYDGYKYLEPEDLGEAINSYGMDNAPFIAPDESYLIFTRNGKHTQKTDLYISYKDVNGDWSEAIDMGTTINTEHNELCASVSPDGKYLFFLSLREGKWNKIYWVDAKIIEELKPKNLK